MSDWRTRMEARRISLEAERTALFRSQKAERAKMEDDKAEKRRQAAADAAATAAAAAAAAPAGGGDGDASQQTERKDEL
jgi:hypothetical protein